MRVLYPSCKSVEHLTNGSTLGRKTKKGEWVNWVGPPHDELLDQFMAAAVRSKWAVEKPLAEMTPSWAEMTARFVATPPGDPPRTLLAGVCNYRDPTSSSHRPLHFYCGVREDEMNEIRLDHPADVWLSMKLVSRQHQRFDPEAACEEAVEWIGMASRKHRTIIAQLKAAKIDPDKSSALLFAAMRSGLVASARLKSIDDLLRGGEQTGWELIKAFAAVARLSPPQDQPGFCVRFSRMVRQELGIN